MIKAKTSCRTKKNYGKFSSLDEISPGKGNKQIMPKQMVITKVITMDGKVKPRKLINEPLLSE
ncbi:MAG: hypothetical protein PHI06_12940 [Desulfobulbaceae bacterium]|nr:hypothetical protein [Desulfobulbaceae bacterium]